MKININTDGFDFSLGYGDVLITDNRKMYLVTGNYKERVGFLNLETNIIIAEYPDLDILKKSIAKATSLNFGDDGIRFVKEIIKAKDLVLDIQR
jgi:hypothetical protein